MFFSLAFHGRSQTLWYDEDREQIPTFDNEGIDPNTLINIYKSDFVMDNIFNSGTSNEALFASVRFDDRSQPMEIKVIAANESFQYYKTVFQYGSEGSFTATRYRGENELSHKWSVKDSTLVEEAKYYGGKLHYRWRYRIDEAGTVHDEKFNRFDKLIRDAIMNQDSLDADARYCVWKRGNLKQMSLYQFNEAGNLKRVELLDTDDLNKAASKLQVDRNDLSESDAEKIRMALLGLTYYWNLVYDEKNDLLKQSLHNPYSEEVGAVEYERDESGNIVSVIADADIASNIPWYDFYEDLSGLSKSKSVYYYQGLELLNVNSHTLYDAKGRPVESVFEYVGHNVGGHRETYRYVYYTE